MSGTWPYVRAEDGPEVVPSCNSPSSLAIAPASFPAEAVLAPADANAPLSATGASVSARPSPSASLSPSASPSSPSAWTGCACYFLLGAGLLAAWNALITATDYFQTAFPGRHMDRLFTLCYLPLCMAMLAFGIRYPDLPPPAVRIRIGYVGFTAAMAAVPLLDALLVVPHINKTAGADGVGDSSTAPASALVAVLMCVAVVGVCDGLCQGALFGEAAQLPPPYTHAVVSGTASSGLLVCLLRLASKASFEAVAAVRQARDGTDAEALAEAERARQAGLRDGTRLYFALAGVLSLLCLVVYDVVLPRIRSLPRRQQHPATATTPEDVQERHPLLLPLELSKECGSGGGSLVDAGGSRGGDACSPGGVGSGGGRNERRGSDMAESDGRSSGGGDFGGGGSPCSGRWPVAHLPPSPASNVASLYMPRTSTGGGDDGAWTSHGAAAAASSDQMTYREDLPAAAAGGGVERPAAVHHHGTSGCGGEGGGGCLALSPQLRRCVALSWPLCGALLVTYSVTLSIFPGFLAEDVHSAQLGDWYPILLITVFNAADLLGKSLPVLEPCVPGRTWSATTTAAASKDRCRQHQRDRQHRQHIPERLAEEGDHHHHRHPAPTSPLLAGPGSEGLAGKATARKGRRRGRLLGIYGKLYDRLMAPALAAALLPLRRPGGLLWAAVLRGALAPPAFLAAARWEAPAAVMAALTAVLGVTNGYLTSQVLTMGPSAVLAVHAPYLPPQSPLLASASVPPLTSPSTPYRSRGRRRKEGASCTSPLRTSMESDEGLAAAGAEAPLLFSAASSQGAAGSAAAGARQGAGGGCSTGAATSSSLAKTEPASDSCRDTGGAEHSLAAKGPSDDPSVEGSCIAAHRADAAGGQQPCNGPGVLYGDGLVGNERGGAPRAMTAGDQHHHHHSSHHHADAEVVENLLVLSLVTGLNVGAYLGWLWLL